jgi:hypothetical protein
LVHDFPKGVFSKSLHLLAHRIEEAHRRGVRYVVTETGVPQRGEPAPSYKNIVCASQVLGRLRPSQLDAPRLSGEIPLADGDGLRRVGRLFGGARRAAMDSKTPVL